MAVKTDYKLLVAVLILIGLVGWLLVVSVHRSEELSRALTTIDQVKSQIQIISQPGKDGYTPIKGVDYFDGRDGVNGRSGLDGQNGQDALPLLGPPGQPGPSAYDVWKLAGNEGTLEDYLTSLKGEKGDRGENPSVRTNEATGDLEYKNPGDVFWQIWLKKQDVLCELKGDCDAGN